MTEDDAFIRILHDNHDNELPWLVYADWLDERGDPRGAYLRAEVDYAAFLLVHDGGVLSKNRLESHQGMENGDEGKTFWYYDELRFVTTVECQGSDVPIILQNLTDLFNKPVIEDGFRLDPNRYKPIGRITFDESYDGHDESEGLLCYRADHDANDTLIYLIIEYTYQSRQLALGNHDVHDSLDFIEVLCNLGNTNMDV